MGTNTKLVITLYVIILFFIVMAIYSTNSQAPTKEAAIADTYYETGRKFSLVVRAESGCNYVIVRSMDGVAVTPALNQPETCKR